MSAKGFVWLAERLLFREICHCGWTEGIGLVMELVASGEFFRITARGRGPDGAVAHTLYFKGWVPQPVLEAQLREHHMPLEAFLQLERCLREYRRRVSFFAQRSGAAQHQHRDPQGDLTTRKDARPTRGRPSRASHSPPR